MKIAWLFLCTVAVVSVDIASRAEEWGTISARRDGAGITINEILADPPEGESGDANRDGERETYGDEFVEIYNAGPDTVNLRGWQIADATGVRHVFPDSVNVVLLPEGFVTVFGGGVPSGFGENVWVASSGRLALNNGGDQVTLVAVSGDTVDVVSYGSEGGHNESLILVPDGVGEWTRPSVEEWDWPFSPQEPNRGDTGAGGATWGRVKHQYRSHG
ncbi:MAG: lamin tail domain-containing protein [Candidatus Eisenbacteria sp.]|nr:lamin tail domain-containing protein [Candidatus Eisenbacteria bacterium]